MLEERATVSGVEPPALQNRPLLFEDLSPTWNAFQVLSRYRHVSDWGSVGPIPFSEMKAYMDLSHIGHGDNAEEFIRLIGAMDDVYIAHMMKKLQRKGK